MTRSIAVLGAALALGACAPVEPIEHLTSPANPRLQTASPRYTSVTTGAQRFRVVEPKDWREMNRQVGPQSGSAPPMAMPMGGSQ